MDILEHAIALAAKAHEGQTDKAGAPYILHPLRVMLSLKTLEEQIVAVLHDVVEDADWTLERLKNEGFSGKVINAIDALTRRSEETYDKFILRVADNPIAVLVKLKDLQDNSDITRFKTPTASDYSRVNKYRKAIKVLSEKVDAPEEVFK